MRSSIKTRKPRPASIPILTDQPLASHRRHAAQSRKGYGGSVLPHERGPVERTLAAAEPTLDLN
ncbi:hypothetical protein [Rhizobium rhizogenes]|uniref:hypothetical protein n=1 Tax=Rhizobium rhizogenes TaxID=359 RepID=UPI002869B70C|nr:hypothetical protein [Rhizobium rhizogenes]